VCCRGVRVCCRGVRVCVVMIAEKELRSELGQVLQTKTVQPTRTSQAQLSPSEVSSILDFIFVLNSVDVVGC